MRFLRRGDSRVDGWHDQFEFGPPRCSPTWCTRRLLHAGILAHLLNLVLEGRLAGHHLLHLRRVSILGPFLKAKEGLLNCGENG